MANQSSHVVTLMVCLILGSAGLVRNDLYITRLIGRPGQDSRNDSHHWRIGQVHPPVDVQRFGDLSARQRYWGFAYWHLESWCLAEMEWQREWLASAGASIISWAQDTTATVRARGKPFACKCGRIYIVCIRVYVYRETIKGALVRKCQSYGRLSMVSLALMAITAIREHMSSQGKRANPCVFCRYGGSSGRKNRVCSLKCQKARCAGDTFGRWGWQNVRKTAARAQVPETNVEKLRATD